MGWAPRGSGAPVRPACLANATDKEEAGLPRQRAHLRPGADAAATGLAVPMPPPLASVPMPPAMVPLPSRLRRRRWPPSLGLPELVPSCSCASSAAASTLAAPLLTAKGPSMAPGPLARHAALSGTRRQLIRDRPAGLAAGRPPPILCMPRRPRRSAWGGPVPEPSARALLPLGQLVAAPTPQ